MSVRASIDKMRADAEETKAAMQTPYALSCVALLYHLEPLLTGTDEAKMAALDAVRDTLSLAHDEGVWDAAYVVGQLAGATTGDRAKVLRVAHNALLDLWNRNETDRMEIARRDRQ